jgi:hypothetical protein
VHGLGKLQPVLLDDRFDLAARRCERGQHQVAAGVVLGRAGPHDGDTSGAARGRSRSDGDSAPDETLRRVAEDGGDVGQDA